MPDLSEHIGAVIAVLGATITITGILIGLVWNDLRKSVSKIYSWIEGIEKDGGVITTNRLNIYFHDHKNECPALCFFNVSLHEKGGLVSKAEHDRALQLKLDKEFYEINHKQVVTAIEEVKATVDDNGNVLLNIQMNQLLILRAMEIKPVSEDEVK